MYPPEPPPIHKLREAQLADSTLGRILRGKEAGEKPAAEDMGRASRSSRRLLQVWDQLFVHDGILCRRFEPSDGSEPIIQFVIPEELRTEVLANLHERAMGRHLGMDKTLSHLKERFYWPRHYNDVQDWCGSYSACASRKNPFPKARAPLTSIKTSYPPQIVAMDIGGPFPESQTGNTHILVVADYFTKKQPLLRRSSLTSSFSDFQHQSSCTQTRDATLNQTLSLKSASSLVF